MKQISKKLLQGLSKRQRIIGAIALGSILLLILILHIPPQRSVLAYCKVYKADETRLGSAKGTTYSVAIFMHRSSNPHDFVVAFGDLDKVAPSDIEPDIKTLKMIFEKIDSDPSSVLSASWSGLGAESSVKTWTTEKCGVML